MKKKIIGYTSGVFDLFHIGHLNIIKNCKKFCDYLIVGVSTDKLVRYKHKKAVIPFVERRKIISSLKYVDKVVSQNDMNKFEMWKKLKFDIMFVGSDWKNTVKWKNYEAQFKKVGVKIKYFNYTKGTSSTLINETLLNLRK